MRTYVLRKEKKRKNFFLLAVTVVSQALIRSREMDVGQGVSTGSRRLVAQHTTLGFGVRQLWHSDA